MRWQRYLQRTNSVRKKCLDKSAGIEFPEILKTFSHANVSYRYTESLGYGENDAALGGTVELGNAQSTHAYGLVKLNCLSQRVLACSGVENQQNLVRRLRVLIADYATNLLKLLH